MFGVVLVRVCLDGEVRGEVRASRGWREAPPSLLEVFNRYPLVMVGTVDGGDCVGLVGAVAVPLPPPPGLASFLSPAERLRELPGRPLKVLARGTRLASSPP
ncbi:hypothetical protein GCM10007981_04700 [Thermocladium modestius]|uniref:Uncharacterized protein n=1 Tax=Thermocladium modestius TaxID=62609 RepID=A0A830GSQ7_9CREN|nr:hypothetical protein [Thermocladium modestius]GGP19751.1 hypothetical protein GCM10007981_04700 [Thermocladium modestius]